MSAMIQSDKQSKTEMSTILNLLTRMKVNIDMLCVIMKLLYIYIDIYKLIYIKLSKKKKKNIGKKLDK